MLFIFSTPVLIRHLWQLKTVVLLHQCTICALLLIIPAAATFSDCDYLASLDSVTTNMLFTLTTQVPKVWSIEIRINTKRETESHGERERESKRERERGERHALQGHYMH
jgi:hypothetical protein